MDCRPLDCRPLDCGGFQPYIPEDFANFEVYNATLEPQDGLASRWDLKAGVGRCTGAGERAVSRSPTASSCTSGYVSHSDSNATLSDVPFSTSDSFDHLSAKEPPERLDTHDLIHGLAGRGCALSRSITAGEDESITTSTDGLQGALVPSSPAAGAPGCAGLGESLPLSRRVILSACQEFSDFKGAEDDVIEGEGWQQKGQNLHTGECNEEQYLEMAVVDRSSTESTRASSCSCHSAGGCVGLTVPCHMAVGTQTVVPTAAHAEVPASAPASAPALTLPSLSTSTRTPVPQGAGGGGGEPPLHEPAQGDLPHGSPCPSPNPSSAEPSGDSSGDESSPATQLPDWMAPGEPVWVGKRKGTVHYVGGVEFAKGIWVGVQLDLALGKSFL